MSTRILVYTGPSNQTRPELGKILNLYRSAMFRETAEGEYEVSAADDVLEALGTQSDWRMQTA